MHITVEHDGIKSEHYVHKYLLEKKSPFFAALPKFKEGKDNHCIIRDTAVLSFEHIVHWLYTDRFADDFQNNAPTMIQTYAAADRFMMPKCMNNVMDQLRVKYIKTQARLDDLRFVKILGYPASSNIAQCVVDQIVYEAITTPTWNVSQLEENFFDDGSEHALQLTRKLIEKSRLYSFIDGGGVWTDQGHDDPALATGCIYHEHRDGEKCYVKDDVAVIEES